MTVLAKASSNLTGQQARRLVHNEKGRLLNKMVYVRYILLTKAKHFHKRHIRPSDGMLHKDCGCKGSVEKTLIAILKGLGTKTNYLEVNRQS
jgi:hypothetical protein